MNTGDNDRFLTHHWAGTDGVFAPYAKGGTDAWVVPISNIMINWGEDGDEVARYPGSVIKNSELYGQSGLTWTYAKRTGRRFGYFPGGGAFDGKGSMYFPKDGQLWQMMGVLNSTLYHNLFLSLTPERDWQVGDVGRIPWIQSLELDTIGELAREQFKIMLQSHVHNPISQYYVGPELLPESSVSSFFYRHPHTTEESIDIGTALNPFVNDASLSIAAITRKTRQKELHRQQQLENIFEEIDEVIYEELGISEETQSYAEQEVFLRTSEDPEDREVPDPESVPEVPDNLDEQVKDLVHHFAMEAVREESDGIIPLEGADEQADMLDRIVERFEDAYGEYAEDRLVEVDDILGAESAADEAYPNLRAFVEDDLFAYHVDTMENTPILWKLSTARLLADAESEGFACFVDYHQLDASLFDRLGNTYLEPRKSASATGKRRRTSAGTTSRSLRANAPTRPRSSSSVRAPSNRSQNSKRYFRNSDRRASGTSTTTTANAWTDWPPRSPRSARRLRHASRRSNDFAR